jgi:hypothetical protein
MFFNLSPPEDIPTKSAFCQARKKIKNIFYSDFFEKTCQVFYEYARPELLKGYRLWACDTTVQKLPVLSFLHTHFGSKYVMRVSTTFSNSVEIFMASDQVDIVVTESLSQKCFWELKKLKIRKSQHDYCVLIAHNLQTIIQYDCIPELEIINQKRTKEYKINRNVGSGIVRKCIRELFLNSTKSWKMALEAAQKMILKSLEMIKPTIKERLRKMLRCNDRHQTELNYKRGF